MLRACDGRGTVVDGEHDRTVYCCGHFCFELNSCVLTLCGALAVILLEVFLIAGKLFGSVDAEVLDGRIFTDTLKCDVVLAAVLFSYVEVEHEVLGVVTAVVSQCIFVPNVVDRVCGLLFVTDCVSFERRVSVCFSCIAGNPCLGKRKESCFLVLCRTVKKKYSLDGVSCYSRTFGSVCAVVKGNCIPAGLIDLNLPGYVCLTVGYEALFAVILFDLGDSLFVLLDCAVVKELNDVVCNEIAKVDLVLNSLGFNVIVVVLVDITVSGFVLRIGHEVEGKRLFLRFCTSVATNGACRARIISR